MSKRILLVEDDDVARGLLQAELAAAGYAVSTADSGEAALSALEAEPGAFAAIVCDVALPGLSGPDALAKAAPAALGGAALLFLSGYGEPDIGALGQGRAVKSLKKPLPPGAALEAVRALAV